MKSAARAGSRFKVLVTETRSRDDGYGYELAKKCKDVLTNLSLLFVRIKLRFHVSNLNILESSFGPLFEKYVSCKYFEVFVTVKHEIPCEVILDSSVATYMAKIDFVLVGAEVHHNFCSPFY